MTLIVEKTFSNNFQEFKLRSYRIESKCESTIGSSAGCLGSCGQGQYYVQNVIASNLEELCEKITIDASIESISYFDENGCLVDITDLFLENGRCIQCCDNDLFVDLDILFGTTLDFSLYEVFQQDISSGIINLLSDFANSYSVNGGTYSLDIGGLIDISSAFSSSVFSLDGLIDVSGSSGLYITYNYPVGGLVNVYSGTNLGTYYAASGLINLSSGFVFSQQFPNVVEGSVEVSSAFTYIAPYYSYEINGLIDVSSDFPISFMGTLDMISTVSMNIELEDVEFSFDDAESITYLPKNIVVEYPDGSRLLVPDILLLEHTFNHFQPLKKYLAKNRFVFNDIVSLYYNSRFGTWSNNFHFGNWNFLFELEYDDDWRFAILIKNVDSIIRIIFKFDYSVFGTEQFQNFDFSFDFKNNSVDPEARESLFYDESNTLSSFNEELAFSIRPSIFSDKQFDVQDLTEAQNSVFV